MSEANLCIGGGLETSATVEGEISSSDGTVLPKNEVKRKDVKRTFKTEKEFLEFTLKYQQVLTERDSAIAVRDKLESLCRELQRQNKVLMDECKRVSSEGQNLRLELSTKFQDAIKGVSVKLDEQKDECLSQLKENEMLRTKLKHLADQYALSEQQYAQKLKQKSLELQIADLKMKQHEEKLIQEQSQMKIYAEQVSQLLATEKNLRLQLTSDGEKFQQFQEALAKSNEVFETFKQEIERMAKSIKELKKENAFLKSKSEKSDITLIELVVSSEFKMTNLGLQIDKNGKGIFIHQRKFANEILKKYDMTNCNAVSTPIEESSNLNDHESNKEVSSTVYKGSVGSLLYLSASRPDIMHAVNYLSCYMEKPTYGQFLCLKRVLRYVKGTENYGLMFGKGEIGDLRIFCDANLGGESNGMSRSGYCCSFGT